ncbi:hypothetical protein [Amycolatopsis plumensis]|uniref:Uncharacterized protein n=1 Tax=Amycolatopsis plumensis TaxID=236508 RepID=A0ABV5U823_9PSEU
MADLTRAPHAARTGLGFLEKLDNPADDGGLVRIRLVLLLVSTLLDRGDTEMAYEIAEPMLAEPVRAAGVAPMGWLRLAVATRVHLPAGSGEAAIELVREAVASTDRHGLSAITARLWLELAQLEERFGQAEEAIACLYRSRAAEQLHARARRQACSVLAGEFGTGEPASVDLDEVLKAVPSRPVPITAPEPAPVPEPEPRTPAWSFGREETPSRPEPRQPAWSFERPRVTADAAETTLMPAVRDEPQPVRPESAGVRGPGFGESRLAERGRESGLRSESDRVRGSGFAEPPLAERGREPEFRSESARGPEFGGARLAERGRGSEVRSGSAGVRGSEFAEPPLAERGREPGFRSESDRVRGSEFAEPRSAERGREPDFRSEPVEVRSGRGPESRSGRGAEQEFRSDSAEVRSRRGSEFAEPLATERGREPDFRSESAEVRSARGAEFSEPRLAEREPEFRAESAEVRSGRGSEFAEPRSTERGREPEVRSAREPEFGESRSAERGREPDFRLEPGDGRSARGADHRTDSAEPRTGEKPPPEADEVRPQPEIRSEAAEPGKTKFSWAALAEARLRETAAERESAPTRVTPALPLAPEPAAEREPWASEEARPEPQPSTRHDAEHGSVAARSVLDRLGISASGGAGGRRRAEDADSPRAEEPARPELAPPPRPEDEPPSVPDYRDEAEPWLPRLRMPPSLEPMEDFGHWTPATAPFPESYARAIAEDEPPPDAGLADLLARALAEHQAGTASAAALVKQLDSQNTGRRNGHGRNGHGAEVPDSRGHGTRD